jgi:hypothetical protein
MPWTAAVPAPSTRRRRCCGDLICPPAGAGAGPSSMGLTPSGFFLSSGSSSTARSAGNQAHAFLTGGKGRIRGLEIEIIVRRPRGGGPEDELELDWIGEGDGRETGGRVDSGLAMPQTTVCPCVRRVNLGFVWELVSGAYGLMDHTCRGGNGS